MNAFPSVLRSALCASVLALATGQVALAEEDPTDEVDVAAESAVHEHADKQAIEKRKTIIKEAQSAIRETRAALAALKEGKSDEALAALERATGKLEIVIARDPTLALAPTDVALSAVDTLATVKQIKAMRARAETHLADGEVQKARHLLNGLASEIVVSVTKLPLATYPDAIKDAAALIDEGKTDAAKSALRAVLNTLVITDHVIPLPVIAAEALLEDAQALAEKDERTPEESDKLAKLIERARSELQVAEALGYGGRKDHSRFYAELEKIEQATQGQNSGKGMFDEVRGALRKLRDKLFG